MKQNPLERTSKVFTELKGSYWEILFWTIIGIYLGISIWETTTYRPQVQLFPLLILVPTLILTIVVIIQLSGIEFLNLDLQLRSSIKEEIVDKKTSDQPDKRVQYERELSLLGWLAVLIAIIFLIGFYLSMLVFLPLFVYKKTGELKRAFIVTVVGTGLAYGVFELVLSTTMWSGILFGGRII